MRAMSMRATSDRRIRESSLNRAPTPTLPRVAGEGGRRSNLRSRVSRHPRMARIRLVEEQVRQERLAGVDGVVVEGGDAAGAQHVLVDQELAGQFAAVAGEDGVGGIGDDVRAP